MKALWIVLIIIVIIGGGWYLFSQKAQAPSGEEETQGTMGMPVPGENVEEMIVSEDGADTEAASDVTVNVSGENFAFNPKEITVKKGQTVTVNFTSETGTHDWVVDEFGAATSIVNAGGTSSVTFVADKAGTFEYYCSVGSHRTMGMVGNLVVTE